MRPPAFLGRAGQGEGWLLASIQHEMHLILLQRTKSLAEAMRLNSLLGLGGLGRKSEKPAESKRHKRLDVLESLGVGQSATGQKPTTRSSARDAVQSLSGSSSDKEELRKWLAGEDTASSAAADVPAPSPAEDAQADAPAEAQDAAASDAVPENLPHATAAEPQSATVEMDTKAVPRPLINWREAFTKAKDQWAVAEGGARCFYHLSDKGLFFEWDQQAGLLFQYFFGNGEERSVPVGDDELPERGPIWSSECPDTHSEVWEVLPLPPTDPSAKVTDAIVQEDLQTLQTPSAAGGESPKEAEEAAPPPSKKRKKPLPPVPVMAPASTADGDDDDDDLRLPGDAEPIPAVLGCEGPPAQSSSSSTPQQLSCC